MNPGTLEVAPGLVLDARRAVWLSEHEVLAISDLHLGYSWSHRVTGNLLPLVPDDTIERVIALMEDYRPRQLAVLGDVVHGFANTAPIRDELLSLVQEVSARTQLRLVRGNHDIRLPDLIKDAGLALTLEQEIEIGPHLLLHGHVAGGASARLKMLQERGGRVVFGHEHPAITLSAGVGTRARCPCFLVAEDALVLPAFSSWAAGTDVAEDRFLSPFALATTFTHAVAIVAGKLLRMPI